VSATTKPPSRRTRSRATAEVDLAALDAMPLGELRDLYRQIGGKGEPIQRRLLIREIAHLVQSRRTGGLDTATQRLLAAAMRDAFKGREPIDASQARRDRAKSPSTIAISSTSGPTPQAPPSPPPRRSRTATPVAPLPAGARILRVWRGRTYEVTVADGGKSFLYNGTTYRSLSKVAQAITGTVWSGPLFFGLTRQTRSRAMEPTR
jgi:hypothetical protein